MWATEEDRCEMAKGVPENEGKRKIAPRRKVGAKERATLLRCLSEGWSEVYARKKARIGKTTLTKYKKSHPKFAEKMEAAKKLQSYFISLQREDQPTPEEMLRKVYFTSSSYIVIRVH